MSTITYHITKIVFNNEDQALANPIEITTDERIDLTSKRAVATLVKSHFQTSFRGNNIGPKAELTPPSRWNNHTATIQFKTPNLQVSIREVSTVPLESEEREQEIATTFLEKLADFFTAIKCALQSFGRSVSKTFSNVFTSNKYDYYNRDNEDIENNFSGR